MVRSLPRPTKPTVAGCRLQAGPLVRGLALLRHQRQAKVHAAELQAHRVVVQQRVARAIALDHAALSFL